MMNLNTLKTDRSAYTSLLSSAIKELRGYPPDITFCAQDGKLEVNRLLLSMYSKSLNYAFSDWIPTSTILLPDFSIVSVRILIELISSGCSSYQNIEDVQDIPKQAFGDVFEIAKLLQIQLNSNNVQAIDSEGENEPSQNTNTSKIKDVDNTSLQNDGLEHELGEHSIYEVACKEWRGEFHQKKFISGTKGLCIFSRGIWMTPNEFEKFSGSSAKKYKQSLRVNGKPIENFLVPDGSRTARMQEENMKQQMNTARPLQPENLVKGEAARTNQVKGSTNKIRKGKDKEYKKDPINHLKVSFIPGTPLEGNIRDIGQCFTTDSSKKDSTANANESFTSNDVVKDSSATVEENKILAKEEDGENSIFEVSCKESKAEFHQDKFISGGQGLCISFKGSWITPNAFEKVSGSKAKKYKESLRVNGKPIKHLIDPEGNRPATPSITQRQSTNLNKRSEQVQRDQGSPSATLNKGNFQTNSTGSPGFSNLVKNNLVQCDPQRHSARENEDNVPKVSNPVKRKTKERANIKELASKIRKQDGNEFKEAYKKNDINPATGEANMSEEAMIGVSHFMEKKRKKEFNGGVSGRNINFKKMELDIMQESNELSLGANSKFEFEKDKLLNKTGDFASDDEIDLSGTPVFMDCTINANVNRSYSVNMDESYTQNTAINESFVNLDESYTENALLIDLDNFDSYGSHVVKEKKSKKKNVDVGQSNDKKADENYQELVAKPIKYRFSTDQTSGLREAFNENNFLSKDKAKILSQELCLTEKQVKDWFQNSRRSKKRTSTVPDKLVEKMDVQDEMDHKTEQSLQEYQHLEKDLVSASSRAGFSGENQKYICELCTKSFITKSKLVKHMASHDGKNDGANMEDENQCRCECGAIYKNPLLLKFHKNEDCMATEVK